MTPQREAFRASYREAFASHLHGGGEAGLRDAYELGRTAMLEGFSVLDLAAIHHEVLFGILGEAGPPGRTVDAGEASTTFFLELLSTYEMVQRGLAEAHETARLEQQHAEQLRLLAEASVAISEAETLEEIAARIPEHAARVLGAAGAEVAVRPTGYSPLSRAFPPGQEPRPDDSKLEVDLLRRNGSSLGALAVFAEGGWTATANDEVILTQLARLAGIALENAELYEQERLVAETLQRRLLPGTLPEFPGTRMACRYLPGWGGSDIGGDWYDAMLLPGNRLALVVGDVMGKGIRAAAGMGQLRVALRAYAIEGHPPATVVQRLDQVVESLDEELATAVYLVYDPAASTLRYANAGHPPPLLLAPDGSCQRLGEGLSPPLGCLMGGETTEAQISVQPGSTLVIYTDGLVERRGENLEVGLVRLADVAASGDPADLDAFCDHLLAGMDADDRGDDIALLTTTLGDA